MMYLHHAQCQLNKNRYLEQLMKLKIKVNTLKLQNLLLSKKEKEKEIHLYYLKRMSLNLLRQ